MKKMKKILILLILVSNYSFSQELNLKFFERLNSLPIESVREVLVEGYGFINPGGNKYLHPKSSLEKNNFLMIEVNDVEYKNKTKTLRSMEIMCSNNMDISKFKSDLLEENYEYQGNSKDKTIVDFYNYKKNGDQKEVNIFYITNEGTKKYQIIFTTRD